MRAAATLAITALLLVPTPGAMALSREQEFENVCGPLCLAFCARWLGAESDVEGIAKLAGADPTAGTSLAGLMQAAANLGLEGRAYRLSLSDLRRIAPLTPAIAHVDGNHFAVVWMDEAGLVTVLQPPLGLRRMGLADFGRRWNGAVLVVSRPGEQPTWGPAHLRWALATAAVLLLAALLLPVPKRRQAKAGPS